MGCCARAEEGGAKAAWARMARTTAWARKARTTSWVPTVRKTARRSQGRAGTHGEDDGAGAMRRKSSGGVQAWLLLMTARWDRGAHLFGACDDDVSATGRERRRQSGRAARGTGEGSSRWEGA